ncbi:MAG: hypothetical protein IJS28_08770 [Synergistaceae bacterium]|nr:hypothetical protein [Synergistaceae bacterium]
MALSSDSVRWASERESELWQLYSHGDIEAREELIIEYRPLVSWAVRKMPVRSDCACR